MLEYLRVPQSTLKYLKVPQNTQKYQSLNSHYHLKFVTTHLEKRSKVDWATRIVRISNYLMFCESLATAHTPYSQY